MALAAGEVVTSGNGICFVRGGGKLLCSGGGSRMIGLREKIPAWAPHPYGSCNSCITQSPDFTTESSIGLEVT